MHYCDGHCVFVLVVQPIPYHRAKCYRSNTSSLKTLHRTHAFQCPMLSVLDKFPFPRSPPASGATFATVTPCCLSWQLCYGLSPWDMLLISNTTPTRRLVVPDFSQLTHIHTTQRVVWFVIGSWTEGCQESLSLFMHQGLRSDASPFSWGCMQII